MKLALILVLLLAAAAGGGWYWYQSRGDGSEVRYRTAKVERGPMAAVVVVTIVVALASERWIERPFRRPRQQPVSGFASEPAPAHAVSGT